MKSAPKAALAPGLFVYTLALLHECSGQFFYREYQMQHFNGKFQVWITGVGSTLSVLIWWWIINRWGWDWKGFSNYNSFQHPPLTLNLSLHAVHGRWWGIARRTDVGSGSSNTRLPSQFSSSSSPAAAAAYLTPAVSPREVSFNIIQCYLTSSA